MQDVKVKFAYKTGFRRLWLVVSVIWLIGAGMVVSEYRDDAARSFFLLGFLPVVAVYVIGAAFVWVIEGFARADR